MLLTANTILEKLSSLAKFPWKGVMVSIALAFSSATIISLATGQYLLKKSSSTKRTVQVKPYGKSKRIGTKPSIDKKAAKRIIDRNLFNSEGKTGEEEKKKNASDVDPNVAIRSKLPLKLKGIIYGGSASGSIGIVENTSKRLIRSFMIGDRIAGSGKVTSITRDRLLFTRGNTEEFIELEVKELIRRKRDRKKGSAPAKQKTKKRGRLAPIANKPPPDSYQEEGFERNKTNIVMSESFKKRMLTQDFARVLQEAKAEPNLVDGELNGFKLTRIRQGSIYEKSGLQNGDIVTEINGMGLTDTSQSIKVLNGLRNEKNFEVRIERGGVGMNLVIEIR